MNIIANMQTVARRIGEFAGESQTATLLVTYRCLRAVFLRAHTCRTPFHARVNAAIPAAIHMLWMYCRKVEAVTQMLRASNTAQLLRELRTRERRDVTIHALTFDAADAVRHRLSSLVAAPLGSHAQTAHVTRGARPGHQHEVSCWMKWQHQFGNHITLGRACHSTTCATPACAAIHTRTTRTEVGPSHTTHFAGLPSECWHAVLEFLVGAPSDAARFVDLSRAHRHMAQHHPLNPVMLHAYLRAHDVSGSVALHQLSSTVQTYATEVMLARQMATPGMDVAHAIYAQMLALAGPVDGHVVHANQPISCQLGRY